MWSVGLGDDDECLMNCPCMDAGLSAEQEIKRVSRSILDRLHQEILTRFSRLDDKNSKFGFLLDVHDKFTE